MEAIHNMRFSKRITILCLIPWLLAACSSEAGYEKAVDVYEKNRNGEKLEVFQGYDIHKRGKSYHIFMPPEGARFVYIYTLEDSLSMKLVNEAMLRVTFADIYEWEDPAFLSQMSRRAHGLINTYEELGVVKINGRYQAGKYIKIYVSTEDVLIYATGKEELNTEDINFSVEKVMRLDTKWMYIKLSQPLDISG